MKWIRRQVEQHRAKVMEEHYAQAVAKVAACFDNPLGGVR